MAYSRFCPNLRRGSLTSRASRISSSSGSSIARRVSNCLAHRPRTIGSTACLPRARLIVRIRTVRQSLSWFGATVPSCMYEAWICWTPRRFSISNPICRAFRPKNCAADGWQRPRQGRSKPAKELRFVSGHGFRDVVITMCKACHETEQLQPCYKSPLKIWASALDGPQRCFCCQRPRFTKRNVAHPRLPGPPATEEHGLSDRQSTGASDRAVDSRGILVRTNDCLQHFWRRTCRIGIKVHHRAANVAHGDGDGGGVVPLAE